MHKVYEDQHNDIEEMLRRYRAKWQLTAIAWMDYDDVCQQIRLHIHKKWHLWKQDLPFKPWVSTLISNQIKNMVRNKLHKFILAKLSEKHAEIYTLLYIEHQEDYVVAERYGFKLDKSKKTPRYKQIKNLRKKFYEMAQKVMQEEDIL